MWRWSFTANPAMIRDAIDNGPHTEPIRQALAEMPATAPMLYRGLRLNSSADQLRSGFYRVGSTFDLRLSSFTTDRGLAIGYAEMPGRCVLNRERSKAATTPLILVLAPGSVALPTSKIGSDFTVFEEEWITAGRFRVIRHEQRHGYFPNSPAIQHIHIEQTGAPAPRKEHSQ